MELIWQFIEDFFKTEDGSLNLLGKAAAIMVIFYHHIHNHEGW